MSLHIGKGPSEKIYNCTYALNGEDTQFHETNIARYKGTDRHPHTL